VITDTKQTKIGPVKMAKSTCAVTIERTGSFQRAYPYNCLCFPDKNDTLTTHLTRSHGSMSE